jgi:aspartyl-tRNA(Asn)/glutamyl-tRNA(Gln) amidotransferase subunit B
MLAAARAAIPELPADRQARYERDFGLPQDTAHLFAFEPEWGDYFEGAATAQAGREGADPKAVAIWVGELRSRVGGDPLQGPVVPARLAKLADLVAARTVTAAAARSVLERMIETGDDPAEIVEREGLATMSDSGELEAIVARVIADNPDVVERIKGGNAKAMGALVGPVMRETKGRADGGEVNRLLREALGV